MNEVSSIVHTGKHLYDALPVHNELKQGDALSPLF